MAKPDHDPYAVLGVARNATPEEIKTAYRELVARYYPDRHQGNPLAELAAAKIAEINRAYEILSDAERRAAYDSGRPSWPRLVDSPFDNMRFDGRRKKRKPWLYLLGLLLLLPLLIRLVVSLLRLLFRLGAEGLGVVRGTPFGLVVLALAVAAAIWLYVRWRRRRG